MDLLDFSDCKLYFEDALPAEAEQLIAEAAADYEADSGTLVLRLTGSARVDLRW